MSEKFPLSEQDWLRESVSLLALAAMKGGERNKIVLYNCGYGMLTLRK